jgi:dihydrofolate synthase/folylpolyglutamate synthase
MADHARSDDPAVQAQLDRLAQLSPGADTLGLERIAALLERLGNPHLILPPVFHVAGTNGKGSTCAVLRAALEEDGKSVHVYTSPHLVRFNERIRIAGDLISDALLADYLRRVLDAAEGIGPSFFEVTTAAAFLAFHEHPADACIIEVGLGGRLDATNILGSTAASGVAQLGIDHEAFLGSAIEGIAREKAGITRPGRPLVTLAYPFEVREAVAETARARGGYVLREGSDWSCLALPDMLKVVVEGRTIEAELPALPGLHQAQNAGLAIAMLLSQKIIDVSTKALQAAPAKMAWSARLQTLGSGPLTDRVAGRTVRLDGGHNLSAAEALARWLATEPNHVLIVGMLANKDAAGLIATLAPRAAGIIAVPIPGHDHHAPADLALIAEQHGVTAVTATDLPQAMAMASHFPDAPVLIAGSLYLAGEALRLNQEYPV